MFKSTYLRKATALSVSFLFMFTLPLFAQNNRNDEPISEARYEILLKKRELIGQEVSSGKNEWSGVYQLGDHHPTVFMWSVTQGFLTWGSNHTFSPSRINFGKAEFLNNRLIIKPEISKEDLNFQSVPAELIPIKWGEQHFLIPADELTDFAYAVHSGAESQIVEYFVKSEDYEKSRQGLPNLPKEYAPILTMKAIKPKITAIKNSAEDKFWETELTLDLGRADKLIKGMIFYYVKPSGSLRIMVTELQEKSSKAVFIGISNSGDGKEIKPKVGLKFTSKIPDGSYDY